jgi:hypothetical protein
MSTFNKNCLKAHFLIEVCQYKESGVLNIGYMSLVVNLSVAIFWNITPGLAEFYKSTVKTSCPQCALKMEEQILPKLQIYSHVTLLHTSKNSNFHTKCALWSMID